MKKSNIIKIIGLVTIAFFANKNLEVIAQTTAPNYQSEIVWSEDSLTFDINISIEKGKAPFTYQLYDKLPNEGGIIVDEAVQLGSNNYTFSALEPNNYILIVSDNSGLKNGRNIYPKK